MKISRYTEAQILGILCETERRMPVASLCRAHRMSSALFYKWRAKYGEMDASLISQMKVMEDENRRLKRMHAGLSRRKAAREQDIILEIVRLLRAKRGFVLLPRRWIVVRLFAWATCCRRLVKDYERCASTLAATHTVAFAGFMFRNAA
ncbi:transposase [Komagataeibacter diospyri]|uniref:Transposase n=1 Tax=Komagataeibacter diospyri TaxID=1932662 RepID=A0A4P5NR77_9PROT|nr:transposase [Komagataeibacter diospyri]